jgi:hypothetical protein
MKKRGFTKFFLRRKRGGSNLILPEIIFVLLNLFFFSAIILFIQVSSTGALVYNQAYAKNIALILDNSRPNTRIIINIDNALKIAEKNKRSTESLIKINDRENYVQVGLGNKGAYKQIYFSDLRVSSEIIGNNLVLEIRRND